MKHLLLVFFFFLPLISEAKTTVKARYSAAANIFIIMDQTSNWWPGFTEEEYQVYWKNRFGLSEEDLKIFKDYADLRWRYYSDPDQQEKDPLKNRNGFFSMLGTLESDPLANAFYASSTLAEALQRAEKLVSKEDLQFLIEFYKHFEPNYSQVLKETVVFETTAKKLNKLISKPQIAKFYDQVREYYGVAGEVNYEVLHVWWPIQKRTLATPAGQYLLMYFNPESHKDLMDQDVVFHEIVHTISMKQSLEQKQAFTKIFLEKCPVSPKLKKTVILEEPLAVAIGQVLFMEKFFPADFHYEQSLYNNPWISTFGRLITPVIREDFKRKKKMDETTISSLANICAELAATTKLLQ